MTKGEKLIAKNALNYITGKDDGRLKYRETDHKRIKNECPKCSERKIDLVSGLGAMGVGQMYICQNKKCGWCGFELKKV
jgi:hypothetical protein